MWISCTLISKSEITSHNWEQRGWRSQDCAARLLSAEARTFWLLLLWDFLLALDRASVNVLMDCEVFCVLCWIRSRDINESVSIKLCKSFRNHCRPVTSEEWRPVARSPRPSPPTRAIIRSCHAVTRHATLAASDCSVTERRASWCADWDTLGTFRIEEVLTKTLGPAHLSILTRD